MSVIGIYMCASICIMFYIYCGLYIIVYIVLYIIVCDNRVARPLQSSVTY